MNNDNSKCGMRSFEKFLAQVGRDAVTGWRWRKKGLIQTVNVFGRLYVTDSEAERFIRRAESGEFAQAHKCPRRPALAGEVTLHEHGNPRSPTASTAA
jgi:hypothetical protein